MSRRVVEKVTSKTPYEDLPQYMTLDQYARHQQISYWTAFKRRKLGLIPCVQSGRSIRIPKEAVLGQTPQARQEPAGSVPLRGNSTEQHGAVR
jgi:hypothetical protein